MSRLGLVLSAGGARGAYEAGVLYYIRSGLPKNFRQTNFPIQTGTSVGAINALFMASHAHDPLKQGERLKDLWFSLNQDHIYRRDLRAVGSFLQSSLRGMVGNLLTIDPLKIFSRQGPHLRSILNTFPLQELLTKNVDWKALNANIENGPIDAVALTATNMGNGHPEIFLQKKHDIGYTGRQKIHTGPLKVEHAMASSAIPMLFPSTAIGKNYYMDGGLRLFTPMSPAIHLGAERLLIIGLRHRPSTTRKTKKKTVTVKKRPTVIPTLAMQLGSILNGMFLDHIQYDLEQLSRINHLLDLGKLEYGNDFIDKINARMKKEKMEGLAGNHQWKKIKALEITPSEFVSNIYFRWFRSQKKGRFQFSAFEKLMIRLLDVDPRTGRDLLSYLTFAPQYLQELFELGYQDAQSSKHKIMELMTQP